MYKILIADDEEDVVSLLKDYLELNQYETICAYNGPDAVEKSRRNPDLILLDINMPEPLYGAFCLFLYIFGH